MKKDWDSRAVKWRMWAVAGLVLVLGVVAFLPLPADGDPTCPLRRWLGIPCLLCGGTRATQDLLHGNGAHAFYLNPWTTMAVGLAILWAGLALIEVMMGRRFFPVVKWSAWKLGGVFLLLLFCWGWHVRSAVMTPKPELLYEHSVAKELRSWLLRS